MTKKERAAAVTELLKTVYPEAVCALHYTHDYELLFATRLSAQIGRIHTPKNVRKTSTKCPKYPQRPQNVPNKPSAAK